MPAELSGAVLTHPAAPGLAAVPATNLNQYDEYDDAPGVDGLALTIRQSQDR